MKALIVGCGDVGSGVAKALAERGAEVHGVRRGQGPIPRGVRPIRVDVSRPEAMLALPRDPDLVVFAVAAGRADEETYRRTYVEGPARVAKHVGLGPGGPRAVFVSSTGVWDLHDGSIVTEETPVGASRYQGQVMIEAEERLRALGGDLRVLRAGGIYGPGRTWLLRLVREGRAPLDEQPPVWTNRIHRDDVVGMILHLADRADLEGTWIGVDAEPSPRADVFRWLSERLGIAEESASGEGAPLPARGSKRCDSSAIRASGYALRYPTWREGYTALLASEAQED